MNHVLDRISADGRVAIVRLRSLGDAVLSTPAIHLLKTARPDLRIAVIIEDRFAEVYAGNPDIDAILSPGVRVLRQFRPDLCLNLHGGPVSARLTALSGAKWRAGFAHYANRWAYNVEIPTAQQILGITRKVHTAEHLASAMFFLGVRRREIPRARLFTTPGALPDLLPQYAVIHPTASHPSKAWPSPFFFNIAKHLKRTQNLQPVFIGGPSEDLSPFQIWPTFSNAPLDQVKRVLQGATLFIGNDSGPAHMAAAFGVPVVVLFGPSDEVTWAPWRTSGEALAARGPIHNITEAQVQQALDRLLVHAG
ncbi:MAG TPA: glycosyl transferase [Solibacterales bacterium]|nr:glycosyl transferase [Bryobacterales bacterium]